jgi:hypothetical protein
VKKSIVVKGCIGVKKYIVVQECIVFKNYVEAPRLESYAASSRYNLVQR